MQVRASHRLRIAIATALVSAVLFAGLLSVANMTMHSVERRASIELLEAPMDEVVASLRSGEPLDEEVGAQEHVTVAVFDPSGKEIFRSGSASIGNRTGSGELQLNGHDLMYRTAIVGQRRVVAAVDWTKAVARLQSLKTLSLMLLIPLSAIVGLAAYVAAGLMYRPLRDLTASAKSLAEGGKIGLLSDPNDPDFSPLAQEINALLIRISDEVERQERLVSDVAHDLRTPLTVIRGRLEATLMQGAEQEYPAAMRIAIREAERLSEMAESILQSGIDTEQPDAIELSDILREATDRWRHAFKQRGALLETKYSKCCARISPEEWASILDNLLDNAFKYGGDHCSVSLSQGDEVILTVKDNGPGVPEGERERVFERFARLDASRSSAGHGLGLYLCASIIRKRSGSIQILIEPGMAICVTMPKPP